MKRRIIGTAIAILIAASSVIYAAQENGATAQDERISSVLQECVNHMSIMFANQHGFSEENSQIIAIVISKVQRSYFEEFASGLKKSLKRNSEEEHDLILRSALEDCIKEQSEILALSPTYN